MSSSTRRSRRNIKPDPEGCIAVIYKDGKNKYRGAESERCSRKRTKGSLHCSQHKRQLESLLRRKHYAISMNFKPYVSNEDGSFRRHYIGRLFETRDEAWEYIRLNWGHISRDRGNNKRFVSCSVKYVRA